MANTFDVVLLGVGGHARVVLDALRQSGETRSIAALDADTTRHGSTFFDVPVIGGDDLLEQLARNGARYFVIGFAGTKNHAPRKRVYDHARSLGLEPLSVRHPSAIISSYTRIGLGCQIMAGAIINASAELGSNVIVNTASVIEHDCILGDHVHVATGARLCGGAHVADLAHIGAGSTVLQLVSIGQASVVGAGALVLDHVPPHITVGGVPARELTQ